MHGENMKLSFMLFLLIFDGVMM